MYCLEMCPARERRFRLEEGLLHRCEKDGNRLVKKFHRSAAGQNVSLAGDIRSAEVLLKTVHYLITEFVDRQLDKSEYHFVFDRLRAVRQDLVVLDDQDSQEASQILAICVRFHLFAHYRLANSQVGDFDPKINFSHALECLKSYLSVDESTPGDDDDLDEMTSVYLILNLGSKEALKWALSRKTGGKRGKSPEIEANFAFRERNFVKLFKIARTEFSTISLLAFQWKLPSILKDVFVVMNSAYSSKVLKFPCGKFGQLFDLSVEQVNECCESLGVPLDQTKSFMSFNHKENVIKTNSSLPHFNNRTLDENLNRSSVPSLILDINWNQML